MNNQKNASNQNPTALPQNPLESLVQNGDGTEKFTNVQLHHSEDTKDIGSNEEKYPEKLLADDKAKQNEVVVTIQDQKEDEEPPSVMRSPIARIRYDWEHSQTCADFCIRVVFSLIVGMSRSAFVNKFPILSIAELIVGAIYLHDCPVDPKIPEYLIVAGFFGTILPLIPVCYKYLPNSTKDTIQSHIRIFNNIEAVLQCFFFVWFIAGCVWVYSAYKPEFVNTHADNYCFRGMYLFIFWLFNITFIIFIFIIIGTCISAICVTRKALKQNTKE